MYNNLRAEHCTYTEHLQALLMRSAWVDREPRKHPLNSWAIASYLFRLILLCTLSVHQTKDMQVVNARHSEQVHLILLMR
jgi:hypothetical protein